MMDIYIDDRLFGQTLKISDIFIDFVLIFLLKVPLFFLVGVGWEAWELLNKVTVEERVNNHYLGCTATKLISHSFL